MHSVRVPMWQTSIDPGDVSWNEAKARADYRVSSFCVP